MEQTGSGGGASQGGLPQMAQYEDVRLMMQAFTTYMQQQTVHQQQQMHLNEEGKVEAAVQKVLEAVIEELKLFDGRNNTQYLKIYLGKMDMSRGVHY